ncbi:MAG: tryptophan--tRNA ligase [Polyangia bacterium]
MPFQPEDNLNTQALEVTDGPSSLSITDLQANPTAYRVLTGDRPTGTLHIGHLFGSIENRVRLQALGVTTFIVIADYQVLTDRDDTRAVSEYVRELAIDYIAAGLDPENGRTFIFPHSYVPELNQLFLPFLSLTTLAELDRNPTVKEEVKSAGIREMSALMYTYPIHQAADILFCKANVVPVGKDQLPHLEATRRIARRFNRRYCPENNPLLPEPFDLLSEVPSVLGLDGAQKMSKSRNNAIQLKASADETVRLIKSAKTDSDRFITYDPERRPEVANLLRLAALCTHRKPEDIADSIGNGGAGQLKKLLADALNEYLSPLRSRRKQLEHDPQYIDAVLKRGVARAREEAQQTLSEVRRAMGMDYGL